MLNRKNYRNKEPHQVILRALGASVIVIVSFWHTFFPKSFAGLVTYIASTAWESFGTLKDGRPFISRQEILNENKLLQMEVARLTSVASSGEAAAEQNSDLKKALGKVGNISTIVAEVLAKPPYTLFDTLVVNKGMSNGLRDGMVTFALGSSTPIGYVLHANENTSVIRLYSSPGEESDVFISSKGDLPVLSSSSTGTSSVSNSNKTTSGSASYKSKTSFRAKGIGGGMFLVVAPRDLGISVGDIVTKPSAFTGYFGRVHAVELDPSKTFANVYFNLPENPKDMRWVEILEQ